MEVDRLLKNDSLGFLVDHIFILTNSTDMFDQKKIPGKQNNGERKHEEQMWSPNVLFLIHGHMCIYRRSVLLR